MINIIILSLIAFVYWFFFMKEEEKATTVQHRVKIVVDGGFTPSVIEVPKGKPITLEFFRKDPTPCLEEIVIADFNIRQFLPLNASTEITITPEKAGEHDFHCGMNMFFGKIKVVES